MAMNRLVSPLSIVVVLLLGFVIYLNLPETKKETKKQSKATPVVVERVALTQFPIVIEALGTVLANESVTLTAQKVETVSQIYFDDGDIVTKGQLLLQLNQNEELARIEELQASIDEAKRQYSRIKNLSKSSAASEQLLDEQSARVKMLQAQVDVAEAQLGELQIRAPFSGMLGIRQVSVGALVRPADVITTLDDISMVKVDFSVAENHFASLAIGQKIQAASVAYPDTSFEGKISSIDTRIDPVARSTQVRAIIDNSDARLRPGMLLQIELEKKVLETLTIDEKALVPVQDKQYVFVVENDKVSRIEVIVGERKPGRAQIVSGLSAGQTVVVEGTLRVQDQSSVRILRENKVN